MFGRTSVVELLLKHGADANKGWCLGDIEDYDYKVAPIMAIVMNLSSWNKQASHEVCLPVLVFSQHIISLSLSLPMFTCFCMPRYWCFS